MQSASTALQFWFQSSSSKHPVCYQFASIHKSYISLKQFKLMYEGSSSHYILHWLVQKRKKKKLGLLHFLALWWSTSMLVCFNWLLNQFIYLKMIKKNLLLCKLCKFTNDPVVILWICSACINIIFVLTWRLKEVKEVPNSHLTWLLKIKTKPINATQSSNL